MCIEDVRMGRDSQAQANRVSVGAGTSQQILGPDPDRYCLVLSPPAAGSITYSIDRDPVDGSGIVFHQGSSPLALDIQSHGDLVRRQWYCYSTNAGTISPLTVSMRRQ